MSFPLTMCLNAGAPLDFNCINKYLMLSTCQEYYECQFLSPIKNNMLRQNNYRELIFIGKLLLSPYCAGIYNGHYK